MNGLATGGDLAARIATRSSKYWRGLVGFYKSRVATFATRHFSALLRTSLLAAFTLLFVAIVLFIPEWRRMDNLQYSGFGLGVVFGLFTVGSFLISLAVLNAVREEIPDYTHAADALEEIIGRTTNRIYILTENCAFLQALDPKGLSRWLKTMENRIVNNNITVTFAYLNRDALNHKFSIWADAVGKDPKTFKHQFLYDHTFHVAKTTTGRERIKLIPLDTLSIPFCIAIADGRVGMFCRTILHPTSEADKERDILKSVVQGFVSYDEHIVKALTEVLHTFLQLNGAVYEYTCSKCSKKTHQFDHDLVAKVKEAEFADAPQMACALTTDCGGTLVGKLKELLSLETTLRNRLYKDVTGEEWRE